MDNINSVHGTCVSIDGHGVLFLGRSGSGKSDLALRLIDQGAILVADDQTILTNVKNSLIAKPVEALSGLLEIRGLGLRKFEFLESCKVCVVFKLDQETIPVRMPTPDQMVTTIENVTLGCFQLQPFFCSAPAIVRATLATLPHKNN